MTDVRVYEVGPRDGLQNEADPIPTDAKLRFIELLADAGLREIEATSFVSPRAIPQLADADQLMARLDRHPGVRYPVLVPNERGLERAEAAGAEAICVFTAASEAFTAHNINMTIAESIDAFRPVIARARERGWWTRGYVSTAFGCPYQGEVGEAAVVGVARELLALGVDELSIGDTIGVAVPADVHRVVSALTNAGVGTSPTRGARPSPTWPPRSSSASAASMPRPAGPAAVRTRPARRATWQPRTSSTSSTGRAPPTASTWIDCWWRPATSATRSAAR
jgi:hydroxymethylglutaryl-CoA lyase